MVEQSTPVANVQGEALTAEMIAGSTTVLLECLPSVGTWAESIVAVGDGWTLTADWGQTLVFQADKKPPVIVEHDGPGTSTWHETVAFIDTVAGKKPWVATPQEVLSAMRISQDALLPH